MHILVWCTWSSTKYILLCTFSRNVCMCLIRLDFSCKWIRCFEGSSVWGSRESYRRSENWVQMLRWLSCSWRSISKLRQMFWVELSERRISANEPKWFSSTLSEASTRKDLLTQRKTWAYFKHNIIRWPHSRTRAALCRSKNSDLVKWDESV